MAESKPSVLFIDDEEDLLRTLSIVLKRDFDIKTAISGVLAISLIENNHFDVVVCDISMPEISGMEVLRRIKRHDQSIEVIMLTALNDTQLAIQAAREGAYDFLVKPADSDALRINIIRAYEKKCLLAENEILKEKLSSISEQSFSGMIGSSPAIKAIFDLSLKLARSDASVLIQGETGTGKELIARAIHNMSARKANPFIAVNCGAIPKELFESEIFGYEKGAFTGAAVTRPGKFEAAINGTIFLDEIASLPLQMQVKLLRVLQDREVCRIGGTIPVPLDIRVITASNEDLKQKISRGEFREDLYHRIAIVPLTVPPLRKRLGDIKLLTWFFMDKFNRKYGKNFSVVDDAALEVFINYQWSGNVRELEHLLERIISIEEGHVIKSSFLPLEMFVTKVDLDGESTFKIMMADHERTIINAALAKTAGNQSKAAQLLGLSRTTLLSKIDILKINASSKEA